MNPSVFILGVRIDVVTLGEARDRIFGFLKSGSQSHIMTPNPEMLVEANRNPVFKDLLNASALNVPDGVGLLWAARRKGEFIPQRVTGIDLLAALLVLPEVPAVFLLGAAPGVAEKAANVLRKKNPSLSVAGTFSGSPRVAEEAAIVSRINASGAEMLFVAFGSPAQDFWIQRNLKKMPSVRSAMGVGGAFDLLAGVRKRAPNIFQLLGIEWLWRLIKEPLRIKRIITAVIVFPYLVLIHPQVGPGSQDRRGGIRSS